MSFSPQVNSRAAGKCSADLATFLKIRYEWSSFFLRISFWKKASYSNPEVPGTGRRLSECFIWFSRNLFLPLLSMMSSWVPWLAFLTRTSISFLGSVSLKNGQSSLPKGSWAWFSPYNYDTYISFKKQRFAEVFRQILKSLVLLCEANGLSNVGQWVSHWIISLFNVYKEFVI